MGDDLWIHQYIGCQTEINLGTPVQIDLRSGLPWDGKVCIALDPETATYFTIHLRIPSWAERFVIRINGQPYPIQSHSETKSKESPASGYDPGQAWFLPIRRVWSPGDVLEIDLEMQVVLRRAFPRLHDHKNKAVLTRGPLVYCLESVDNPGVDIFTAHLNPSSVGANASCVAFLPTLLGGTKVITGETTDGKDLVFIPYFLWANRVESQMTVWVNS
jgi:DUF1680 family protein